MEKAIALEPGQARWHAQYSLVLKALRKHEESEAELDKAIGLAPNDETILELVAERRLTQGRYDEAGDALRSSLRREPGNRMAQVQLMAIVRRRHLFLWPF